MKRKYYHFMWKFYKTASDKYLSKFGVDNFLMFMRMKADSYFKKWTDTYKEEVK